jgi:HK97 family phage prohead protease
MLPAPELKFAPLALQRVDAAGTFAGYASLFDTEDLGRDVIARGAFRDSLAAGGAAGVRMLFQHNPAEPIGVWESIREDALGLHVRGRLTLAVARSREVHALMRAGALDGLSIGFRAVAGRRDPRTGIRRLIKVDLWEISIVTFPLLPGARIAHVKARRARLLPDTIAAATRMLRAGRHGDRRLGQAKR